MMFTQAASLRSTSSHARSSASLFEPMVVKTTLLSVIRNNSLLQLVQSLDRKQTRAVNLNRNRLDFSRHRRKVMKAQIKFGTSGWRAVMADEFTFENVRRAVVGVARHVSGLKPSGAGATVGPDPRFLGSFLVAFAAAILSQHGVSPTV